MGWCSWMKELKREGRGSRQAVERAPVDLVEEDAVMS